MGQVPAFMVIASGASCPGEIPMFKTLRNAVESTQGFFAFLLGLFDLASEDTDTGSGMDPNGIH